jgi:hypothetical protein
LCDDVGSLELVALGALKKITRDQFIELTAWSSVIVVVVTTSVMLAIMLGWIRV